MNIKRFIRSVHLNDDKRIVITANDAYQHHLASKKVRRVIRKVLFDHLSDDLVETAFSVGQVVISVSEGKELRCLEKVNQALAKPIGFSLGWLLL